MARAVIVLLLLAGEAAAHEACAGCGSRAAEWDGRAALALLSAMGALYAIGLGRLWVRAGPRRGIQPWRAGCFAAGLGLTIGVYASPLHGMGDGLFTAHMFEHELLIVIAAPLLALSRPFGAFVWALPESWRRPAGALAGWRGFALPARLDVATLLHGAALWVWHVPDAYLAALAEPGLHWLQHVTVFATALLFWHAVFRPGIQVRGASVFCVFVTALHTGLLGILLTVSRMPLYPGQSVHAPGWGLSPMEDQQLAGILMWVPGGLIYAAAALGLCALWIRGAGMPAREVARVAPAE